MLNKIKMIWDARENAWNKNYELAKSYFEHYGNLKIPRDFKTKNGYEYDENGLKLGSWISMQRQAYLGKGTSKITEEQIKMLKEIGMRFEIKNNEEEWNKKYELAKSYFEHYGNLKIPNHFKTINGYQYDENGIRLDSWIFAQKQAYIGKGKSKITEEQIKMLEEIGMRFEIKNNEEEWNKKYELAKSYYDYHKNLKIPQNFKTINGYEYDENGIALGIWISHQRQAYFGIGTNKITEERIKMLEEIGMIWFFQKTDDKLQLDEINETNITRKNIEILNRTKSVLNKYADSKLPSKEEINQQFLDELDHISRHK
jgi:hypothetical protein